MGESAPASVDLGSAGRGDRERSGDEQRLDGSHPLDRNEEIVESAVQSAHDAPPTLRLGDAAIIVGPPRMLFFELSLELAHSGSEVDGLPRPARPDRRAD